MDIDASIFKAYDIRGIYPTQLDEKLAYKIGLAFSKLINPKKVIVGRDGRVHGPQLFKSVIDGLLDMGVDVVDVGQVSSDMYYHACATKNLPGIMVTASHNPKEYNGFKMVRKIPELLSGENGIHQMRDWIIKDELPTPESQKGSIESWQVMPSFIEKITSIVDLSDVKPMKIYADMANGMVGPILEELKSYLPDIEFVEMYWDVDGTFPNHGGDPLDAKNREEIESRIVKEGGELGIMADPDGDRFFAIDAKGRFISGDFMTAILSEYFLQSNPGANIVYDIRASKIVPHTITKNGGAALANRVGHSYIKARMTSEEAVFAGEVSGHYYFKDFYLVDSAAVSFLMLLEYLSKSEKTLTQLNDELLQKYFISGEINSVVNDADEVIAKIEKLYGGEVTEPIERMDGITLELGEYRFNVRKSNTEPKIRLCLEANSKELMEQKRDEVLSVIRAEND